MSGETGGGLTERDIDVIIEAAHPSRPDRETLTRHHVEHILAAHLADRDAALARVEALAEEWEELRHVTHDEIGSQLRAALHPDPSETT